MSDRRAALANELERREHIALSPDDERLIIEALRAHLYEDVIGKHSGGSDRREWWSGGTWLYPGDEIVSRRKPA